LQEEGLVEIFVEIPKWKYAYLKKKKKVVILDILKASNVYIKLLKHNTEETTIILRGLYKDLSFGDYFIFYN